MALRKTTITQTDTATWSASSSGISTNLDRTGLITRINATVEVTPSATLAGANQTDGLMRVVQNLRVEGGSHTYITLPGDAGGHGGTLLHHLGRLAGFGIGHSGLSITAPQLTYNALTYYLHFGSRPKLLGRQDNPFDMTAFIPAHSETQLRAIWVTTPNSVMDDTVTISSATMRFTLNLVQGSEGEIRQEMARQGCAAPNGMVPAWTAETVAPTATATDFSFERDVPLGAYLRRIAILAQDATATRPLRADDEVTGIALKFPYQSENLLRFVPDFLKNDHPGGGTFTEADDAVSAQGAKPIAAQGIYVVDLRPHTIGNSDYGLDLTRYATGAVKLGFTLGTNAAGDDILILYDRLMPNRAPLAPAS